MEVNGQKSSQSTPTKQLCEPCENLGKRSPAKGYCVECREYLCQGCTDVHRGGKMSRSHKILCGFDMPANHLPSDDDSTLLTDICTAHQKTKELIKFFCPTHDDVICGDCAVMSHRSCKVDYIIDVAKRYKGSQKYNDFNEFMAGIGEKLKRAEKIIQDVTENNTKSKQEAMDEIMKLRAEVIAYFDEKQQELTDEMDKIAEDDTKFLQSKSVEFVEIRKTFDTVKEDIDTKDDSPNQLFVSATQNKPVLEELDNYADSLTEDCESRRRNYKFKPNQDVEKLLKGTKPLGTVVYETGTKPGGRRTTPATHDVRTTVSGLSLCTGKVSCKTDGEIKVITQEDRLSCAIAEGDHVERKVKIPEQVEIPDIDIRKVKYIKQSKSTQEAFKNQMDACQAIVLWPSAEGDNTARIVCTIQPQDKGARKLVKTWTCNAKTTFDDFMDRVAVFENDVGEEHWDPVIKGLKKNIIDNPDSVALIALEKDKKITVVGMTKESRELNNEIRKSLKILRNRFMTYGSQQKKRSQTLI